MKGGSLKVVMGLEDLRIDISTPRVLKILFAKAPRAAVGKPVRAIINKLDETFSCPYFSMGSSLNTRANNPFSLILGRRGSNAVFLVEIVNYCLVLIIMCSEPRLHLACASRAQILNQVTSAFLPWKTSSGTRTAISFVQLNL